MREHDRRLVLRNMGGGLSEIRGKSADNPTSLLGEGLDFVIVDEASMVDLVLMDHLLRAIDRHSQLILVGDVDQLPSVGAGAVLTGCVLGEGVVVEPGSVLTDVRWPEAT